MSALATEELVEREVAGRRRAAVQIALEAVAAELGQPRCLLVGLDALGGHPHPEYVAGVDDQLHQRVRCRRHRRSCGRSSSTSIGSVLRCASEAVAGAEVVDGDRHAVAAERVELRSRIVEIAQQRLFAHLEHQVRSRAHRGGAAA